MVTTVAARLVVIKMLPGASRFLILKVEQPLKPNQQNQKSKSPAVLKKGTKNQACHTLAFERRLRRFPAGVRRLGLQ